MAERAIKGRERKDRCVKSASKRRALWQWHITQQPRVGRGWFSWVDASSISLPSYATRSFSVVMVRWIRGSTPMLPSRALTFLFVGTLLLGTSTSSLVADPAPAPTPPTAAGAPSPSPAPPGNNGEWQPFSHTDPMHDSQITGAYVTTPSWTRLVGSPGVRPDAHLTVRLKRGRFEVWMSEFKDRPFMLPGRLTAYLRWDGAKPVKETWDISTTPGAVLPPSPRAFAAKMAKSKRLLIELHLPAGNTRLLELEVEGFDYVVAERPELKEAIFGRAKTKTTKRS